MRNWQRKLKDGAPGRVWPRPEPSSVSFYDRAANRQPHAQALTLGRIEGVEKTIEILRIQPRARILHFNQYVGCFRFGHLESVFLRFSRLQGAWATRRPLSNLLRANP